MLKFSPFDHEVSRAVMNLPGCLVRNRDAFEMPNAISCARIAYAPTDRDDYSGRSRTVDMIRINPASFDESFKLIKKRRVQMLARAHATPHAL